VQLKTRAKLLIPVHPALRVALAASKVTGGCILKTSSDASFTAKGFSNFMADKIAGAGLPERCVTHGLRKAAARRLAEAGCSANEISAITGHATLAEVSRYTKAAEQKKLARTAIARLSGGKATREFQNLLPEFGKNFGKANEIKVDFAEWRTRQDSNL
jgi:enterobacteria phage integrase